MGDPLLNHHGVVHHLIFKKSLRSITSIHSVVMKSVGTQTSVKNDVLGAHHWHTVNPYLLNCMASGSHGAIVSLSVPLFVRTFHHWLGLRLRSHLCPSVCGSWQWDSAPHHWQRSLHPHLPAINPEITECKSIRSRLRCHEWERKNA